MSLYTYYLCQFKCVLVPIPMKKPVLQNRKKTGLLVFLGSHNIYTGAVHTGTVLRFSFECEGEFLRF